METIRFNNAAGEEYATLSLNNETHCYQDTWTGSFGTQDNLKKVLLKGLEIFREVNFNKLLSDTTLMIGSFDSSKDWIWEEVTTKLIEKGLRFHAVIIPKNVFSRLSVSDYAQQIDKLELKLFDNYPAAKEWLQSK